MGMENKPKVSFGEKNQEHDFDYDLDGPYFEDAKEQFPIGEMAYILEKSDDSLKSEEEKKLKPWFGKTVTIKKLRIEDLSSPDLPAGEDRFKLEVLVQNEHGLQRWIPWYYFEPRVI